MENVIPRLDLRKALLLSVMVHAVFITSMGAFGTTEIKKEIEPIVVVLAPDSAGGSGGGTTDRILKEMKPSQRERRHAPSKARKPSDRSLIALKEVRPAIPESDTGREAASAPDLSAPQESMSESAGSGAVQSEMGGGGGGGYGTGEGTGVGSGSGTGSGSGAGSVTGTSRGSGSGHDESVALKNKYLREHFVYIRDLIVKHLDYPPIAKKLGWHGAVTVSFIILETGQVENIRTLQSSGHEILDENVVTTVRKVQPFPRPPVKAEIIIPVTYRLE
ncbi:MAG: energy transducer TonB [Syntrophorhabdales bacterium]